MESNKAEESEQSSQIVQNLLAFKTQIGQLSKWYLLRVHLNNLSSMMSVMLAFVGTTFVTMCGYFFLNQIGDPTHQASFGISNSYYLVFFTALNLAVVDKVGIALSVTYGRKEFARLRLVFTQGLLAIGTFITLVSFPLLAFSGAVLRSIGIADANADICQDMLRSMCFVLLLQCASDTLRTYCMAQGQEHYFGRAAVPNLVLCFFTSYLFMVVFDMQINGWIISKAIYEFVFLAVGLWVYFKKTEPEGRGLVNLSEALEEYAQFFGSTVKMAMGNYAEFLGFEIATYFVARTKDQNQIAAYTAILNLSGVFYCIGISYAVIVRTRINILIGMRLGDTAKNYFKFAYLSSIFTGVLLSLVALPNRSFVSLIYASSTPEMKDWFMSLSLIYFMFLPCEVSFYSALIGIKTTNQLSFLIAINCVSILAANTVLQMIAFHFEGKAQSTLLIVMCCLLSINISCSWKALTRDWYSLSGHQTSESVELQIMSGQGEIRDHLLEDADQDNPKSLQ